MSENPLDPALAESRREMWREMTPQAFAAWRHNPVSRAFYQYLEDQVAAFREMAADLVESGAFAPGARVEAQNPDVVRGHILALRGLCRITVPELRDFYGQEGPQADETGTDEYP
jgi:hypothetical protein